MRLVTGNDLTVLDIMLLLCGAYSLIVLVAFVGSAISTLEGGPGTMVQNALNHPIAHAVVLLAGIIGVVNTTRKGI